MNTVLVVDDDDTVREVVVAYLHRAGLLTTQASDGLQAVAVHAKESPRLVILDVMMPGIDGLEALSRMRQRAPEVPVILLTAKATEDDRVAGLEVGADDYVTKPFSAQELVLRVQALLRRSEDGSSVGADVAPAIAIRDGDLTLDRRARTLHRGGRALNLTTREFDLAAFLMSHPGVVVGRDELMERVWGWDFGDDSTVTVHVRRLRNKIEVDPASPRRLVTVWGKGYRWEQAA
ncbi:response regulator transcription factor [Ornithinimicrobium sp. Arc0846-15]|nr:response regulator transcription factor [Ornithinimicrobium laminariae]